MGTKVKYETRDGAQELIDNTAAQAQVAPDLYELESSDEFGRPAFAQLDLRVLREVLTGKDGQPGLLDLYEQDVLPRLNAAEVAGRRVGREGDIRDVEELGVRATEAFKAANPEQARLMEELNTQAMEDLEAGASLPPSLQRELEQQVRSSQAARGMGYGMVDVGQESLIKGLQAEQLQRRRQGFAQQVAGMNAATAQDPFMAILGRPGVNVNQGAMIAGQGQSFNPGQLFNPESAYLGSVHASNMNAANNAAIQSANNRSALIGAGIGAAGSMMGGMAQGATGFFKP
jgi:hypothetical protein